MIMALFEDFRMNSTSWLTVLGAVAGASEIAISKNIQPEIASVVFGMSLLGMGILGKGIEKK
jgi:hypothetical protein